jgi:hypothetical protein
LGNLCLSTVNLWVWAMPLGIWYSQWGVMVANHCHLQYFYGLTLCAWHWQGYDHTHSCLCFGLAGTDAVFTLKVFNVQFSLYSHGYVHLQVLD